MADQLLVCTVTHGHNPLEEIQEPLTMTALGKEEVHTLHKEAEGDTTSHCYALWDTRAQVQMSMLACLILSAALMLLTAFTADLHSIQLRTAKHPGVVAHLA